MSRQPRVTAQAAALVLALTVPVAGAGPAVAAGGKCRPARVCSDTTVPAVSIASPVDGALVAGDLTVRGTAADNKAVASVRVRVDGNPWQTASGTSSWSTVVPTFSLTEGNHTVSSQAVDTSGNVSPVASRAFVLDRVAPSVHLSAPAGGSSVSGTVVVSGTATDANGVSSVEVRLDGGTWREASGASAWSLDWDTTATTDGSHTLTARATDSVGWSATTSQTVVVANQPPPDTTPPTVTVSSPSSGSTVTGTVPVAGVARDDDAVARVDVQVDGGAWNQASGTASWTWPWDSRAAPPGPHTLTVRATDIRGNTATASVPVSVASSPAPDTQGTWTSPEGVRIEVSSAGPWTIAQVYDMVRASARDLEVLGPALEVRVQDQYSTMTQTRAVLSGGRYGDFSATITLQGVGSGFASRPDDVVAHEYGHVWSMYGYYVTHGGSWGSYLDARWTTADGGLTLATDSRTNSSYSWNPGEIVADDYRLLFGSEEALAQRPGHLNVFVPEPTEVPGLRDHLLTWWAG